MTARHGPHLFCEQVESAPTCLVGASHYRSLSQTAHGNAPDAPKPHRSDHRTTHP